MPSRPLPGCQCPCLAALAVAGLSLVAVSRGLADDAGPPLADWLARFPLAADTQAQAVVAEVRARGATFTPPTDLARWQAESAALRQQVLDQVVLRGQARAWSEAPTQLERLDRVGQGPGYTLTRARLQVLPGLWIPALWYEPDPPLQRAPGILHVNGHEPLGQAAPYKQRLSTCLARRGCYVLDLEWFGMGQLRQSGLSHYRLNQLDLCGTSGLAPFYLALRRGIDALAANEGVDPRRIAVTGLSGGGWQTILIAALDTRVALAHPVAGYGSLHSNVTFGDFGDSEQAPADLGRLADYTHLTALVAPRNLLLTYNAADDCCFRADHSLPPLASAADSVYRLLGSGDAWRTHVNEVPGTHNYERDNRQAFYAALGDYFFPGDRAMAREELDPEEPARSAEELAVPLPEGNLDFHRLALGLADQCARARAEPSFPSGHDSPGPEAIAARRQRLTELIRSEQGSAQAALLDRTTYVSHSGQLGSAAWYRLIYGAHWTIPVTVIAPQESKQCTLLLSDAPEGLAERARPLLEASKTVIVAHLYSLGAAEVRAADPAVTYGLALDTVGRRPLGLLVDELLATVGWIKEQFPGRPVGVVTYGPRSGLAALAAQAIQPRCFGSLESHEALETLREVIDRDWTAEAGVDLFCFGLLAEFEVDDLAALARQPTP